MPNSMFSKMYHSPTLMTWANLLSKTVGLALLLPLVLSSFSESDIILWYVLTTMVGIGLLFDLGFTPTFVRFVAYANAGSSIRKMSEITKTNEPEKELLNKESLYVILKIIDKNYFILSLLAFVILLCIGSFIVAKPISQSSSNEEGWLAWIIVSSTTSFLLYGNKYVAVLQGIGKIAENQRVMMLSSVLATLTASFALIFDANLMLVIALYQGITSLSVLLNRNLVKNFITRFSEDKQLDSLFHEEDPATSKLKKAVFSSAWKSAIGIMMSVGLIHLSGIAAANYLRAEDAAMYLLALQLIRAICSFSQAPFYTKIPTLAGYYAKQNSNELQRLAFNAEFKSVLFFTAACLFAGLAFPFAGQIFKFNASLPDTTLWVLLSLGFLVERVGAMHIQLYSLTNKIIWHYVNGITGLCMIALFIFFVDKQGVLALPISLLISYAIFYFPISTFFASRVVGKSFIIKQSILMAICLLFLLLLISL